jgi:GNAT superfamily N-acetyltransferase
VLYRRRVFARVEIRDGQPADVPRLEALQLRASLVWEDDRENLTANPAAVTVPSAAVTDGRVRVALCGAEIAGFSLVLPLRASVCELDGLFVDPRFMRRGIGRALVADLVARARVEGATRLTLDANPHAAAFYEAAGFSTVGETQTDFGTAPRMELLLTSG